MITPVDGCEPEKDHSFVPQRVLMQAPVSHSGLKECGCQRGNASTFTQSSELGSETGLIANPITECLCVVPVFSDIYEVKEIPLDFWKPFQLFQ